MTYFGFLLIFLVLPIGLLAAALRRRLSAGRWKPILLMVGIALLYTTPWDNYLVATRVWWYDPDLVTGIVLGWVPVEEYTFFVLQPILVGLWLVLWHARLGPVGQDGSRGPAIMLTGVLWLAAVAALLLGWTPGTYLALELAWALPPVMLQLAFGADLLWRYRRLVLVGIVPLTLYLSAADALAIGWGTWTISPSQSTGLLLGGVLPVEEFIFFLLTNTLVTFGLVLIWAPESRARLAALKRRWRLEKQAA
jgi:lycopene cyclase domain-containing protein